MRCTANTLVFSVLIFAVSTAVPGQDGNPPRRAPSELKPKNVYVATDRYTKTSVEGWTVYVNKTLLADQKDLGDKALRLLETKLYEIERRLPPRALEAVRKVPIWLGVDDGHAPCAEYHPSKEWLSEHGYNPDKAKGVEIGNAGHFLKWSLDQPAMLLHELSHAYHDQVLGYDHAGIKEAFHKAVASKRYESVLRGNGRMERAYALSNDQEYFAEASEAYFGANDFYPFVRAELEKHDPQIFQVLSEVWGDRP